MKSVNTNILLFSEDTLHTIIVYTFIKKKAKLILTVFCIFNVSINIYVHRLYIRCMVLHYKFIINIHIQNYEYCHNRLVITHISCTQKCKFVYLLNIKNK